MTASPELASDAEMLRDPRWFPTDFEPHRQTLGFAFAERDYWATKRFLDRRWMTERLPRRALPAGWVREQLGATAPPNLNFIWHTSFCCSTLIADLIERLGLALALREPQVLVTLAETRRLAVPVPEIPYDSVFRLLARRFGDDARISIKPSNFANNLIGEASARTAGHMLFLYSDLPGFLLAIARKGQAGRGYARALLAGLMGDGELPSIVMEQTLLSDAKVAALVWHMQIAIFQRHLSKLGPNRAKSLDCAAFLAAPARALRALDAHFGLELGEEHIAQATGGPLMKRHAKELKSYDANQRDAENVALRAKLGSALDDVVGWSYEMCPATPREGEILHPLLAAERADPS